MGNQSSTLTNAWVQTPEEATPDQWVIPVSNPLSEPFVENATLDEKFFWSPQQLCVGPVKLCRDQLLYFDFELSTDTPLPPLLEVSLVCCDGTQGNTKTLSTTVTPTLPVKLGISSIAYQSHPSQFQYVYFNLLFAGDVQDQKSVLATKFQATYKKCEDDRHQNDLTQGTETVSVLVNKYGTVTVTGALIGLIRDVVVTDMNDIPLINMIINNGRSYTTWMDMCMGENGYHFDNAADMAYYEVVDTCDNIQLMIPEKANSMVKMVIHWVTF